MRLFFLFIAVSMSTSCLHAQEQDWKNKAYETFHATRVINVQSVEMEKSGVLKFLIQHRFGRLDGGFSNFFGLDDAGIRLGLDYGLTENISFGLGRSSLFQTVDAFGKIRLMQQQKGEKSIPFTLVFLSAANIRTIENFDPTDPDPLSGRMAYAQQLLIARKLNERFSFQLSPTFLHRGRVLPGDNPNTIYLGVAAKWQLSKLMALNLEGHPYLNGNFPDRTYPSLGLGLDFITKGHVFQLHFTNSRGMVDRFFLAESTSDFFSGQWHFGFNISRDFKLR